MMLNYVKLYMQKLETLLFDRRLLYYVVLTILTVKGMPGAVDAATSFEGEAVEMVKAVGMVVEMVGGMIAVLISWGIRPPSGKAGDVAMQLINAAREAGMKV